MKIVAAQALSSKGTAAMIAKHLSLFEEKRQGCSSFNFLEYDCVSELIYMFQLPILYTESGTYHWKIF